MNALGPYIQKSFVNRRIFKEFYHKKKSVEDIAKENEHVYYVKKHIDECKSLGFYQ